LKRTIRKGSLPPCYCTWRTRREGEGENFRFYFPLATSIVIGFIAALFLPEVGRFPFIGD